MSATRAHRTVSASSSSKPPMPMKQHPPEHQKFRFTDFELVKQLGKGAFGIVYEARNIEQDFTVALKVAYRRELQKNNVEPAQLRREVEIQYGLKHQHILRLFAFFEDDERYYIVLEIGKFGSLYKLMYNCKRLTLHRTCYIVDALADALIFCHGKGVVHRDLKPENVVLTANYVPKLCDFGWAVKDDAHKPRKTVCGTEDYVAPELANGLTYDYRVDNWALGVLAYECLTGQLPHRHELDKASGTNPPPAGANGRSYVFNLIVNCNYDNAVVTLPGEMANIVRKLLKPDMTQRMELSELVKEPFLIEQVAHYHKVLKERGQK